MKEAENKEIEKHTLEKSAFTNEIIEGAKRAFPIVLGYLPLGFAFGVLAVKSGIPAYLTVIMSVLVYAGSGQFIAASMVGMSAPILSIIIANFLINLRYCLMVSSLLDYIKPLSFFKKILFASQITDESFAVHYINFKEAEKEESSINNTEKVLFATNIVAHMGWIGGSLLGAISGGFVADIKPFGLDYALPAMFIALLVPLCFERLQLFVALLSAFLLLVLVELGFGRYALILTAILGASIGAYLEIRKERNAQNLDLNSNTKGAE